MKTGGTSERQIRLRGVLATGLMILGLGLLFPVRAFADITPEERAAIKKEAEDAARTAAKEYLDGAYPELKGEVTIRGIGEFGHELTADVEIKGEHGKLEYTWYRYDPEEDKTKQVGTKKNYVLQDKDVGYVIKVEVTAQGMRGILEDQVDREHNGGNHIHRAVLSDDVAPFAMNYEPVAADDGTVTYTVEIPKVLGCEYSFDGESWSDYNILAGVAPGSTVIGYVRYKDTEYIEGGGMTTSQLTLPQITKETAMMANPGQASPEAQAKAKEEAKAGEEAKAAAAEAKAEAEAEAITEANIAEKEKEKAKEEAAKAAEEAAEAARKAARAEQWAAEEAARAAEEAAKAAEAGGTDLAAMVTPGAGSVNADEEAGVTDPETAEQIEKLRRDTQNSWIRVVVIGAASLILVGLGFELLIAGGQHLPVKKWRLTGKMEEK